MSEPVYTATVDAAALARVTANALAFMPARSRVEVARIELGPSFIAVTASDTYTVGTDWTETEGDDTQAPSVFVEVAKDDLQDLDKSARAGKKGNARLDYFPGDSLMFTPDKQLEKAEVVALKDITGRAGRIMLGGRWLTTEDFWPMCDDLMARLEEVEIDDWPKRVAFDPALVARFNKVRVPSGHDAVMDLLCQGEGAPVLVRVGPSFVGAIMPIDREVAAGNPDIGQEGLW